MQASRTINPLHFEDLEPHRFEDLVRQLVYDFRHWQMIEAVGRLGADKGVDIRAVEAQIEDTAAIDDSSDSEHPTAHVTRTWLFQCKRERAIGPKKLRGIVAASLGSKPPPEVFVIVAACDFSLASRDAFRDSVTAHRVDEFYLWGKAELEDMLFRPQNDHLLFAYFGISLQVRRRSARTAVRTRLALKRRAVSVLGELSSEHFTDVLIRDPDEIAYPWIEDLGAFLKAPKWRYWRFIAHQPPDNLAFVAREHFAQYDPRSGHWDALLDLDTSWPGYQSLSGLPERWEDDPWMAAYQANHERYRSYWYSLGEGRRAYYRVVRFIHLDRVLAIDELGDYHNKAPHLLVQFGPKGDPFEPRERHLIHLHEAYVSELHPAEASTRRDLFPTVIPEPQEDPPEHP